MKKLIVSLVLFLLPAVASAQQVSPDKVERLKPLQESCRVIVRLQAEGQLNQEQADHYRQQQLQLAAVIAEQSVPSTESLDDLIHKSDVSRFSGFFTFINIVWVLAAVFLVVGIGPYAILWPGQIWEVLGYGLIVVGLFSGAFWPSLDIWFVVPAALLMVPLLSLTNVLHFHGDNDSSLGRGRLVFTYSQFVCLACTVTWGVATVTYQSYLLGFMTVIALEALLGFSAIVIPGCVGLGFNDEDDVAKGTVASLIILAIYVLTQITGGFDPKLMNGQEVVSPLVYFRTGALFMGAFVYYLGLLILASTWYNRKRGNYILTQIVMIVSGIAAFFLGATFGLDSLLGLGGTIFVLYLLEKYAELPWKDLGWAWGLLGLSGLLYTAAWIAGKYPEYFLLGLK